MCVVSMVYDDFSKRIPWVQPFNPMEVKPLVPSHPAPASVDFTLITKQEAADIRQLIKEFREAIEAAKVVDRLTRQPDCVDPEKAKLEERVAALEAELAKVKASKGSRVKKRQGRS